MATNDTHGRTTRCGAARRMAATGTAALLLVFVVGTMLAVDAAPSFADGPTTFTNPTSIAIPGSGDGSPSGSPASPYPSGVAVSGLTGNVANVTVTFANLSHTSASDIHALLVGPTGANIDLMADLGGGNSLVTASNATITFDDAAVSNLPGSGAIASGSYKPTNDTPGADSFPSPAPAPSSDTTLASAFDGTNPNGTWQLYVSDDASGDTGTMAGGWSVTVTTAAAPQPGTLSFSQASYTGAEGDGSAAITIDRTGGSDGPVSVQFDTVSGGTAVEGTQYSSVSQSVSFADGQTSASVSIPIIDDNVVEGANTTVDLALSAPGGGATLGQSSAVLVIEDNDSASNATPISIPGSGTGSSAGAPASPYPSNIHLQNLFGPITNVNVTLTGLSHTSPQDIDALLVGPQGQNIEVMSDVGGGGPASNVNLTFSDEAEFPIGHLSTLSSGNFKPSNDTSDGPDLFPAPAPVPSSATTLSTFDGTDPNGTWSLYITDDASGDVGSLASWSLSITTLTNQTAPTVAPTDVTAAPAASKGTAVVSFTPISDTLPGNGGSTIIAYVATCSALGQTTRVNTSSTLPFGSVTVTKLVAGVTYTCTAAAENAFGVGPSSAPPASVTMPTAPTVAPTGVSISPLPKSGNAEVSFNPIADSPPGNGGSPITSYGVRCSSSGNPTRSKTSSALPGGSITLTGLVPGGTYTCVAVATNAVGSGPTSAPSGPATLPTAPIASPSITSVSPSTPGRVVVAFTPISDVAPDNGGSSVVGYVATCSASGEPTRSKSSMTLPGGSITVTGLVSGVSYTCTVSAINGIGTGPASAPSGPVIPA